jgi:hypothetical protein
VVGRAAQLSSGAGENGRRRLPILALRAAPPAPPDGFGPEVSRVPYFAAYKRARVRHRQPARLASPGTVSIAHRASRTNRQPSTRTRDPSSMAPRRSRAALLLALAATVALALPGGCSAGRGARAGAGPRSRRALPCSSRLVLTTSSAPAARRRAPRRLAALAAPGPCALVRATPAHRPHRSHRLHPPAAPAAPAAHRLRPAGVRAGRLQPRAGARDHARGGGGQGARPARPARRGCRWVGGGRPHAAAASRSILRVAVPLQSARRRCRRRSQICQLGTASSSLRAALELLPVPCWQICGVWRLTPLFLSSSICRSRNSHADLS